MGHWGWARIDIDDSTPEGYQVVHHEDRFDDRDEALVALRHFLERSADVDASYAMAAQQLRQRRTSHGPFESMSFGGMGMRWVVYDAYAHEPRLFLTDARGQSTTVTVDLPDQDGPGQPGPAPTPAAPHGRIGPKEVSVPLRIEGLAIGLCFAMGALFAVGGLRSWLDPSRWEMGRILFVPALAVMAGAHYWGKNFRVRAFTHLREKGASGR